MSITWQLNIYNMLPSFLSSCFTIRTSKRLGLGRPQKSENIRCGLSLPLLVDLTHLWTFKAHSNQWRGPTDNSCAPHCEGEFISVNGMVWNRGWAELKCEDLCSTKKKKNEARSKRSGRWIKMLCWFGHHWRESHEGEVIAWVGKRNPGVLIKMPVTEGEEYKGWETGKGYPKGNGV